MEKNCRFIIFTKIVKATQNTKLCSVMKVFDDEKMNKEKIKKMMIVYKCPNSPW